MDLRKAKQFWSWFEANNAKYLFLNDMTPDLKTQALKSFQKELHEYCNSVYFLIGNETQERKRELIITAEGNKDYFNHVEFLIDGAPKLERWELLKFKPPMGKGFKAVIQNREFDPRVTRCLLLDNTENPDTVGLRMYYNDFNSNYKRNFAYGTYVMLDMLLGEKSATLDIDHLEIVKTPKNIDDVNFIYLDQIKKYIDIKKAGH